jgi:outer membrane lipoprotein carrier protein
MQIRKTCLAMLCASLLWAASAFADDSAKALAEKVDRRYNSLHAMKAEFTQSFNGAGVSRSESGTLSLKRPGKMRWDYRTPREKLFVSDGKTAYFYVPGDKQARRAPVKNIDDMRTPLRFLLGKARLQKEFDDLSIVNGAKLRNLANVVIGGTPKHMADRVNRVLFEVTKEGQIQYISIEEVDGSITEFAFTNIQENIELADSTFKFTAPAGIELVEATELSD